jgi:putative glutamine amidotransferase
LTRSLRVTSGSASSSEASGGRPLIGITASVEEASYGAWTSPSALVPLVYVQAVEKAGGRAFVVPPSEETAEETLDVLDGILFSGGADLDPAKYGSKPHPETYPDRPERDQAELALLTAALERDMPVLAVCRGSQILNVARGGDLVQHLPEVLGHERHRHTPGEFADHDVNLAPASRVGALLGERAPVKSHHHQGFGRIGEGLSESGWAEDGTVEALEDPSKRFAVGVLWHPEEGEDMALFEGLVQEARRYRKERR